jgi:hypothetical protein
MLNPTVSMLKERKKEKNNNNMVGLGVGSWSG